MKQTILVLVFFIGINAIAQKPIIYKLKFDNHSTANLIINEVESLHNLEIVCVTKPVIEWQYNPLTNDSLPILEPGYFCDIISKDTVPDFRQYILNPYPKIYNHGFAGLDSTNTTLIKPY